MNKLQQEELICIGKTKSVDQWLIDIAGKKLFSVTLIKLHFWKVL